MTITESNIVLNHTGERIISADSHVAITQDQVKANLDPKFHPDYDKAQQAFSARALVANLRSRFSARPSASRLVCTRLRPSFVYASLWNLRSFRP